VLLTTGLFLLVNLDTNLWWIRAIMFLRGCFIAFTMVSMQTALFSAVPREKTGRASSLFSTSRQVAVSFGVAVAGAGATRCAARTAGTGSGGGQGLRTGGLNADS